MKDPFITFGITIFGGTVAIIGFLVFMVVTGDFSCSRPYVDGYQPNVKCSYNGITFPVPIAPGATPGTARK